MTDKTLAMRGVVSVPLFNPPWTFPVSTYNRMSTGLWFESMSVVPQVSFVPTAISNANSNYTQMIGYVPNLDNPSIVSLNPTATPSATINTRAIWTDNCLTTVFAPGVPFTDTTLLGEVFQPRISGVWSSYLSNLNRQSFRIGSRITILTPFAGRDDNGLRVRGILTENNSGAGPFRPWMIGGLGGVGVQVYQDIAASVLSYSGPNLFAGVDGKSGQAVTYDTNIFHPDNLNRMVICNSDNAFRPPAIHFPLLWTFKLSLTSTQIGTLQTLSLDNPVLNALFQLDNGFVVKAVPKGFLIIIHANGTGPTGQVYEFLYCNADMDYYYLLAFAPQTTQAQTQLSRTNSQWTAAIDTDGTLWFNSGHSLDVDHLLFSFAFYGNPFPPPADVSMPPFKLDCINTCGTVP